MYVIREPKGARVLTSKTKTLKASCSEQRSARRGIRFVDFLAFS